MKTFLCCFAGRSVFHFKSARPQPLSSALWSSSARDGSRVHAQVNDLLIDLASRGMHALRAFQRLAHLKHAASVATAPCCRSLLEPSVCSGAAAERVLNSLRELTHLQPQQQQQQRGYAGSPAPQQIRDFAIIGETDASCNLAKQSHPAAQWRGSGAATSCCQ